jgi:hypothetical protein
MGVKTKWYKEYARKYLEEYFWKKKKDPIIGSFFIFIFFP